ncbi:NAD(P)H-dependent oxidoreductase, partial [Salmonella enterica]|uniref:NAD(P)H-dependent oxidoreductase n=2 Tax=Enterobacteriaceae TaxID=543 RepID=UPI000AEDAA66
MKKTLIVVAHPNIENSVVNRCWINELKKYPDQFTVHELYKAYPDGRINIETEQRLVEQHESLVLQFPVYWFNCPP